MKRFSSDPDIEGLSRVDMPNGQSGLAVLYERPGIRQTFSIDRQSPLALVKVDERPVDKQHIEGIAVHPTSGEVFLVQAKVGEASIIYRENKNGATDRIVLPELLGTVRDIAFIPSSNGHKLALAIDQPSAQLRVLDVDKALKMGPNPTAPPTVELEPDVVQLGEAKLPKIEGVVVLDGNAQPEMAVFSETKGQADGAQSAALVRPVTVNPTQQGNSKKMYGLALPLALPLMSPDLGSIYLDVMMTISGLSISILFAMYVATRVVLPWLRAISLRHSLASFNRPDRMLSITVHPDPEKQRDDLQRLNTVMAALDHDPSLHAMRTRLVVHWMGSPESMPEELNRISERVLVVPASDLTDGHYNYRVMLRIADAAAAQDVRHKNLTNVLRGLLNAENPSGQFALYSSQRDTIEIPEYLKSSEWKLSDVYGFWDIVPVSLSEKLRMGLLKAIHA